MKGPIFSVACLALLLGSECVVAQIAPIHNQILARAISDSNIFERSQSAPKRPPILPRANTLASSNVVAGHTRIGALAPGVAHPNQHPNQLFNQLGGAGNVGGDKNLPRESSGAGSGQGQHAAYEEDRDPVSHSGPNSHNPAFSGSELPNNGGGPILPRAFPGSFDMDMDILFARSVPSFADWYSQPSSQGFGSHYDTDTSHTPGNFPNTDSSFPNPSPDFSAPPTNPAGDSSSPSTHHGGSAPDMTSHTPLSAHPHVGMGGRLSSSSMHRRAANPIFPRGPPVGGSGGGSGGTSTPGSSAPQGIPAKGTKGPNKKPGTSSKVQARGWQGVQW